MKINYILFERSLITKILVTFLCLLIVVAPLAPLLAEEATADPAPIIETPPVDLTPTPDLTLPPDTSIPPSLQTASVEDSSMSESPTPVDENLVQGDSESILPEADVLDPSVPKDAKMELQLLAAADTDVAPVVNPIGVNKQIISPQIDKTTGALNYEYPITLPPGRNNLTPDISIAYNSSRGENDSIVGYGWNFNIPFIERVNKTGTENLYTANNYTSSLSGELSLVSGTTWAARDENGNFLDYQYNNNQWTVKDKSGATYVFGATTQARQDDPADATHIYKWMLESVTDTNGNTISYTYFKNSGQIYPSLIDYASVFQVEFERESQPHPTKIASPAFMVTTNHRIKTITAKFNNEWVKKYELTYTKTVENNRSLLAGVQESGKDNSGAITTLPVTSFDYTTNNGNFNWVQDPGWQNGPIFSGPNATSTNNLAYKFGDVNGDGLTDAVSNAKYYFNTGKSWKETTIGPEVPVRFINPDNDEIQKDYGVRLIDANGDGLPDILFGHYRGSAPKITYSQTSLNINGSAWVQNVSYNNNTPMFNGGSKYDFGNHQFDDINGDGLSDVACATVVGRCAGGIYRNNGYGWTITNDFPSSFDYLTKVNERPEDSGLRLIDLNGDQLADLIGGYDGKNTTPNKFSINNGKDWVVDSAYPAMPTFSDKNALQFGDVNGDNLTDIVCSSGWDRNAKPCWNLSNTQSSSDHQRVYFNDGQGFNSIDASSAGLPSFIVEERQKSSLVNTVYLMDINGDGLSDILEGYNINNVTSSRVLINQGIKSQLLKTVTASTGSKSTVSYKPSTSYRDASGNLLNPKLAQVVYTVSSIVTEPGQSNQQTTNYIYADGYYYYNDAFDRKFAGFGLVISTDSVGNITKTYYHQGNTSDSSHGEYDDDKWKIGKPYRVETADSSGDIYSKTINKWEDFDLGNGSKFVKLAQTVDYAYDGDSTHKDKAEAYTYDDTNGNVMQKIEYGEVEGSDDGSFSDIGNDKFTSSYTYATNGHGVFQVSSQNTVDQNSNKIKESKLYYDDLPFGQLSLGNKTKQEDWKNGTSYTNTQKIYDGYGLVTKNTDANGNATNYVYDTHNLYPASVTNALNQTTNLTYNYASGQVKQKTDPNGRVSQYAYDGLGRLLSEKQPDISNPSSLVTKTSYEYTDTPNNVAVRKTDYLDATTSVNSYSYFDGFGRKIQEKKKAENGYSTKDYTYNSLGLLDKESLQYNSSSSSKTSPNTTNSLRTNYTYDPLGRVITIMNSLGATTNTYDDWKLTITDANNKTKDLLKDAYGNLVQVNEKNSGNTYSTYYTYNYLDNLTKITDALGNIRNFTYDGLGRRLTAEDLHTTGDITFGIWNYSHDDAGNLIQVIDPNNNTINYTYDALNRQLLEKLGAATMVTNTYDGGTDGIGRLTSITTPALTQTNTYNALGGVKSEAKLLNAVTYTTNYDYDIQGNQTLITNPDNSQIKYIYNSAGLINQVQRKESIDSGFTDVVSNFDYSPTEQPTIINYANGVSTTNTYDSTKLYRLIKRVSLKDTGHLQDLSYTYDNVGNITKIVDASATNTAKTADYVYDDLYRLTQATVTNVATGQTPYIENYSYDAIGNILSKTGQGGYIYAGTGYANPHAVTSIGANVLTYDNNGNLLVETGKTYTWDYNNKLTKTLAGPTTVDYTYDTGGQRLTYTSPTGTTYYPSKFYNIDNSGKITKHIFANGVMLADITSGGSDVGGTSASCKPPATGDWTISTSCIFTGTAIASASVIVDAGKVLTLSPNSKLLIDLKHYKLLVKKTGGVLIKQSAALRQVKASDTNATPVIAYTLADHLGSTQVSTDTTGAIIELSDYYPYGNMRLNTGSFKEQRKYIGEEYDVDTGLSYLNARYYGGNIGRFVSQDPVFWEVGESQDGKTSLLNPQLQNSYSYSGNNPITSKDPNGRYLETAFDVAMLSWSINDYNENPGLWNGVAVFADAASLALPIPAIVGGLRHGDDALKLLNKADSATETLSDTNKALNGLPDSTVVCRAGTCGADNFAKPGEVKNGLLNGSSVTASPNATIEELTKNFQNSEFGQTILGQIRALGGDVTPSPSLPNNPFHADLKGITPKEAEKLFKPTIRNPNI